MSNEQSTPKCPWCGAEGKRLGKSTFWNCSSLHNGFNPNPIQSPECKDRVLAQRDATIREQGAKIAELIKACKVKDGQLEKAQVANKRHQRNKKSWSRYKQQRDGEIATLRRLLGEVCEAEQRMRELFNTATWLKLCNVSEAARAFLSGEQPAEVKALRNLLAGSPVTVQFISNGIRGSAHGEQPKAEGGE
jgi:hypothetical protein